MADEDEYCDLAVAYWYFLRNSENTKKRKQGKKRQRRFWIHEVISRREELGEYHRLVHELRHDPERFRRYFRMSTSQFDMLLGLIGPEIAKLDTNWRRSVSPAERLAITLRSVCFVRCEACFSVNFSVFMR